jgi:hypothetical protein
MRARPARKVHEIAEDARTTVEGAAAALRLLERGGYVRRGEGAAHVVVWAPVEEGR